MDRVRCQRTSLFPPLSTASRTVLEEWEGFIDLFDESGRLEQDASSVRCRHDAPYVGERRYANSAHDRQRNAIVPKQVGRQTIRPLE